jgi:hypothetical protein
MSSEEHFARLTAEVVRVARAMSRVLLYGGLVTFGGGSVLFAVGVKLDVSLVQGIGICSVGVSMVLFAAALSLRLFR